MKLLALALAALAVRVAIVPLAAITAACSSYDANDYTSQVRARAAAELRCDPALIKITPIPDSHGTHTFVCDGCGCLATYICQWKDYDSCQREPTLEPDDAGCK